MKGAAVERDVIGPWESVNRGGEKPSRSSSSKGQSGAFPERHAAWLQSTRPRRPAATVRAFCLVLLLTCCGHRTALAEEASEEVIPSELYTHPNQLVAIQGTRRLNLLCVGTGAPVVLFDAGAGFDLITWRHVQAGVATFTRACAYDRAGLGYSDPAVGAVDALSVAEDLHRLLHAAAFHGPVVYVAHSAGGLYGLLFEQKYPDEIAGAVLVDPVFPGQFKAFAKVLPARDRHDLEAPPWLLKERVCLDLARRGALSDPLTDEEKYCAYPVWYPETVDDVLHKEISRRFTDPKVLEARRREFASLLPSKAMKSRDEEELSASVSFGNRPLIVLTPEHWYAADDSDAPGAQARELAVWVSGHDALAALSRHGSHIVVHDTGHFIQTDQPRAVIDAVKKVMEELTREGIRGQSAAALH